MRIYLAARYSRREELCEYREQLRALGHDVQARWLNGGHQISDAGTPIGDHGEALVESNHPDADWLRAKFAQDDWEGVTGAELVINFTEPPRSKANRGGRHVEFGVALAKEIPVFVVGYRENIFHWLPCVKFFESWEEALLELTQTGIQRHCFQCGKIADVTLEQVFTESCCEADELIDKRER